MPSRSETEMRSSGVWMSVMPFARLTHGSPRSLKTFASAPPPESGRRRVAGSAQRLRGDAHGGSARERVAPVGPSISVSTVQSDVRRRMRSHRASPARGRRASCRSANVPPPRASTTPERCSAPCHPWITPTFALDSWSMRPRRMSATRATRRESQTGLPPDTYRRVTRGREFSVDRFLRGCAEDDLADWRGLVEDVAEPRFQPRVVEGVGAQQDLPPPSG